MKLFSAAGKIGIGIVAAQAVTAGAAPLLTRLYDPEAFSLFAYYFSLSSILAPLVFFRLDAAIAREHVAVCGSVVVPALSAALVLSTPIILILACGWQLAMPPGGPVSSGGSVLTNSAMIAASSVSFAAFNASTILLSKALRFRAMNAGRILRAIVSVFFQMLFSVAGPGIYLYYGEVLGRAVGAIFIGRAAGISPAPSRTHLSALVKKYRDLVVYGLPAAVLNSAALNLYPVLVITSYPMSLVGQYFLVHKIVATPVTLVAQSLSTALLGNVTAALETAEGRERLRMSSIRAALILLPLALALFLVVHLVLLSYSELIFGVGWEQSPEIVKVLLPLLLAQVAFTPFSQLLVVLGASRTQLCWDTARLILIVCSALVPVSFAFEAGTRFMYSLHAYSWLMALMYLAHFLLVLRELPKNRHDRA